MRWGATPGVAPPPRPRAPLTQCREVQAVKGERPLAAPAPPPLRRRACACARGGGGRSSGGGSPLPASGGGRTWAPRPSPAREGLRPQIAPRGLCTASLHAPAGHSGRAWREAPCGGGARGGSAEEGGGAGLLCRAGGCGGGSEGARGRRRLRRVCVAQGARHTHPRRRAPPASSPRPRPAQTPRARTGANAAPRAPRASPALAGEGTRSKHPT